MKKRIHVVGAVIITNKKILCAQRGNQQSLPGLWEFPGGKIEDGETARDALRREITEELKCEIRIGKEIITHDHEYDFGVVSLTTFFCELEKGYPQLTEHQDVRWVQAHELSELEWAPADIPTIEILQGREPNNGE